MGLMQNIVVPGRGTGIAVSDLRFDIYIGPLFTLSILVYLSEQIFLFGSEK